MELPKIRGKALTCVKVLYGLITTFVFGLIALYWFLGVIFTPLFAQGLISESSMEALIPISLVVFGGFSLVCFAALNHQVLVNEIRLSEISTIHIGATTIGCVICIIFSYYFSLILLTPIALVITLYYFAYLNSDIEIGSTPTSQNHPPQEQV